jgi:hypothetical protein
MRQHEVGFEDSVSVPLQVYIHVHQGHWHLGSM